MGRLYSTKCKKCGYEHDFYLGIGMMFPSHMDKIIERIRNGEYGEQATNELKDIEKMSKEEQFNFWWRNLENYIYSCPRCMSVYTKPYFHLKNFEPTYRCENCHKANLRINIIKKPVFHRCPECKQIGFFNRKEAGLWD